MLLSGLVFHRTTSHSSYGQCKDLSSKAPFRSWRPPWLPMLGLPPEPTCKALCSSLQASKEDASSGNLNALHLDLDGYDIALDNCTTGNITFTKDNFIATSYIEYGDSKAVKGVGGPTTAAGCGSVKWMLTEEDDELHMFILHNVNYVPTSPLPLLSPQQLSYDLGDDKLHGTYITTYADQSNFVWSNKQY
jgi:hypothetical protein